MGGPDPIAAIRAMPVVTNIVEPKRSPNRRNVFLDGRFAFACNLNVVARFRLREGMNLTVDQVRAIEQDEVRQECLDRALNHLRTRLHSRAELARKLKARRYRDLLIGDVLDDLIRLGYIDDKRFAQTKARSAAEHRKHGRRRAMAELLRSGVTPQVAQEAIAPVYDDRDSLAVARELAVKQAPRLRKLDPLVARRRLVGMLARRGFSYDEIAPVVDQALGRAGRLDDGPRRGGDDS